MKRDREGNCMSFIAMIRLKRTPRKVNSWRNNKLVDTNIIYTKKKKKKKTNKRQTKTWYYTFIENILKWYTKIKIIHLNSCIMMSFEVCFAFNWFSNKNRPYFPLKFQMFCIKSSAWQSTAYKVSHIAFIAPSMTQLAVPHNFSISYELERAIFRTWNNDDFIYWSSLSLVSETPKAPKKFHIEPKTFQKAPKKVRMTNIFLKHRNYSSRIETFVEPTNARWCNFPGHSLMSISPIIGVNDFYSYLMLLRFLTHIHENWIKSNLVFRLCANNNLDVYNNIVRNKLLN